MPITFSMNKKDGYFLCTYSGKISDQTLMDAWKAFYEGDEWIPGTNELSDLSDANPTGVTSEGLRSLAAYAKLMHAKHQVSSIKIALYAPQKVQYGLSRIYSALTYDSPENIEVFDDMEEAIKWVKK